MDKQNLPIYLEQFKDQLYDKFRMDCMYEMKPKLKLRTYCLYKLEFGMEPYLETIINFKLRNVISKLRLSSHDLEIERGRYQKPKLTPAQRLCKLCNLGYIEDEIHMLLFCPLYKEERNNYTKICSIDISDLGNGNVNHILCSIFNSKEHVFYTAMFIKKCFDKRKCMLEDI